MDERWSDERGRRVRYQTLFPTLLFCGVAPRRCRTAALPSSTLSQATVSNDAQSNQPQRLDMLLRDSVHGGELMDLPVTIRHRMNHAGAAAGSGAKLDPEGRRPVSCSFISFSRLRRNFPTSERNNPGEDMEGRK